MLTSNMEGNAGTESLAASAAGQIGPGNDHPDKARKIPGLAKTSTKSQNPDLPAGGFQSGSTTSNATAKTVENIEGGAVEPTVTSSD